MSRPRHRRSRRPRAASQPPRRDPGGRIARALHGFIAIELDPFMLGVFRMALGAFVLLYYIMLAPSWLFYYGEGGISLYMINEPRTYTLLTPIFWYARSDVAMWTLYGLSIASAVLLALGIWWRVAALWLWHMNLALMYGNPYVVNGEEQVMGMLFLFAVFMPLGASFTLRQLRSRQARRAMLRAGTTVRTWALKPLQVHLVLVYLLSVPAKFMSDPAWLEGTVVYYAMMAVDYPRWPGIEIFAWGNAALSRVLTLFALGAEILVPVLIWFRRLRVPCVLAAMSLHVGMGLLIEGVMMFNGAMLVAWVVFLPGRPIREWLARRLDAQPNATAPAV